MKLHVLLISRHYLDGTSEGLCAARAAVALAKRGHRVTVLANDNRGAELSEPDVEHAAVAVMRVSPITGTWLRTWEWFNQRAGRSIGYRVFSALANLRHSANAHEWAWVLAASAAAERIVENELDGPNAVDVLFSRLNPVASHQAARRVVRRRPGLPWCAYFSDPWPHYIYPKPFSYSAGPWSRRRSLAVLRDIFDSANTVLFPSERLLSYLSSFVWTEAQTKRAILDGALRVAAHCGPPGRVASEPVSDSDLESAKNSVMTIRHAGFLMDERKIDALLEALRQLPEEMRAQLKVEFMGRSGSGGPPSVNGLNETVAFVPFQSSGQSFEWMSAADVALLVESDVAEGIFMPSKLADYAFLQRPILAMSPQEGTVADVLANGGGLRADPMDSEGIRAALERMHGLWSSGSLNELAPSQAFASQFDVDTVGGLIEEALVAAVENCSGRRRSVSD